MSQAMPLPKLADCKKDEGGHAYIQGGFAERETRVSSKVPHRYEQQL